MATRVQPPEARPVGEKTTAGPNAAAATQWSTGDACVYYSANKGHAFLAKITSVDHTGAVQIDLKPEEWLTLDTQSKALTRPWSVGASCIYHSVNKGADYEATITGVNDTTGEVQVNLKPNVWFSLDDQAKLLKQPDRLGGYHTLNRTRSNSSPPLPMT